MHKASSERHDNYRRVRGVQEACKRRVRGMMRVRAAMTMTVATNYLPNEAKLISVSLLN